MAILVGSVTTCTNPLICYHLQESSAEILPIVARYYIYKLNVQQKPFYLDYLIIFPLTAC